MRIQFDFRKVNPKRNEGEPKRALFNGLLKNSGRDAFASYQNLGIRPHTSQACPEMSCSCLKCELFRVL